PKQKPGAHIGLATPGPEQGEPLPTLSALTLHSRPRLPRTQGRRPLRRRRPALGLPRHPLLASQQRPHLRPLLRRVATHDPGPAGALQVDCGIHLAIERTARAVLAAAPPVVGPAGLAPQCAERSPVDRG